MCFDGVKRLCHIRGKLRKKVWINQSDIILVGLRDYQDAKADVILKYTADEARNLKTYGELPGNAKINQVDNDDDDEDIIMFDDVAETGTENVMDPGKQKDVMMPSTDEDTDTDEDEDQFGEEEEFKQDFSQYGGKKDQLNIDDIQKKKQFPFKTSRKFQMSSEILLYLEIFYLLGNSFLLPGVNIELFFTLIINLT